MPWSPWSLALIEDQFPKAFDPQNPSSKPRQTVFDYARWHGQHAWIESLASAKSAPARGLLEEHGFAGAGTLLPPRCGIEGPWLAKQQLVRKTVAAVHQRHLARRGTARPATMRAMRRVQLVELCPPRTMDLDQPLTGLRDPCWITAKARGVVSQQDHQGAPRLLREILGNRPSDKQEKFFRKLLGRKDEVNYGARSTALAEAQRLLEELDDFAAGRGSCLT